MDTLRDLGVLRRTRRALVIRTSRRSSATRLVGDDPFAASDGCMISSAARNHNPQ